MDLLPKIRLLSGAEAKALMVLTMFANFKREPLGEVDLTVTELADRLGTSRGSVRRSLDKLERLKMIRRSPFSGSLRSTHRITVIHYVDQGDPPPGSPRSTKSSQVQPFIEGYEPPRRSEYVSEKEVKRKEASTTPGSKKSKSKSASKKKSTTADLLLWDSAKSEVTGDAGKARLREKIYQHYDDLGEAWINATWASWHTYCDTHPDYVEKKKDLYLAALNWFSGDAKKERQRHQ